MTMMITMMRMMMMLENADGDNDDDTEVGQRHWGSQRRSSSRLYIGGNHLCTMSKTSDENIEGKLHPPAVWVEKHN
jgi:hypothetical protein